ncbi:hypothetical protein LTR04_003616 [Oleoguttula sp. CCFEE 6159]|nr:hypothetical protein LTR04_003616 [Oleoguttula sp. CCFEE 6159]
MAATTQRGMVIEAGNGATFHVSRVEGSFQIQAKDDANIEMSSNEGSIMVRGLCKDASIDMGAIGGTVEIDEAKPRVRVEPAATPVFRAIRRTLVIGVQADIAIKTEDDLLVRIDKKVIVTAKGGMFHRTRTSDCDMVTITKGPKTTTLVQADAATRPTDRTGRLCYLVGDGEPITFRDYRTGQAQSGVVAQTDHGLVYHFEDKSNRRLSGVTIGISAAGAHENPATGEDDTEASGSDDMGPTEADDSESVEVGDAGAATLTITETDDAETIAYA